MNSEKREVSMDDELEVAKVAAIAKADVLLETAFALETRMIPIGQIFTDLFDAGVEAGMCAALLGERTMATKDDIDEAVRCLEFWIGEDAHDLPEPMCKAARAVLDELAAYREWQPIDTAPKDGRAVLLLSLPYDQFPARIAIGQWNPDGNSWVSNGLRGDKEVYELQDTGVWSSGGGWFQPDEVSHWMPLPPSTLTGL